MSYDIHKIRILVRSSYKFYENMLRVLRFCSKLTMHASLIINIIFIYPILKPSTMGFMLSAIFQVEEFRRKISCQLIQSNSSS